MTLRRYKIYPLKSFWNKTTLKPCIFWAGVALDDWTRDYLNITSAQFLNSEEKKSWLEKMIYLHYWMNLGGLLHNFWKWQHTKLSNNVYEIFCQADKLFLAEIWNMTKYRFCFNEMLSQLLIHASRGWGWFYSKTFHVLDFLSSWELIWLISFWVICLWNKFTGKAPCEFVLNEEEDYSLSLIYSMSGKIPLNMHLEYIKTIWLIYVTLSTVITFEFTLVRTNLLILTF